MAGGGAADEDEAMLSGVPERSSGATAGGAAGYKLRDRLFCFFKGSVKDTFYFKCPCGFHSVQYLQPGPHSDRKLR